MLNVKTNKAQDVLQKEIEMFLNSPESKKLDVLFRDIILANMIFDQEADYMNAVLHAEVQQFLNSPISKKIDSIFAEITNSKKE